MKLDLARLANEGVRVEMEDDAIIFFTNGENTSIYDQLRELSAMSGFNELETDEVCMGFRRVYIMSAIRRASNW